MYIVWMSGVVANMEGMEGNKGKEETIKLLKTLA